MVNLLFNRINHRAFDRLQIKKAWDEYANLVILLVENKPSLWCFDHDGYRILSSCMYQLLDLFQPTQLSKNLRKITEYFSNHFVFTCHLWANLFNLHHRSSPKKRELLSKSWKKKVPGNFLWSWFGYRTKSADSSYILPSAPINLSPGSGDDKERPLYADLSLDVLNNYCNNSYWLRRR